MLVQKSKLYTYLAQDSRYWFTTRTGTDPKISRNAYFDVHPDELLEGQYCAVGNDDQGWQLEQYLNENWITVNPNPNYNLLVTNRGLKALADAQNGGYRLYISGIKIREDIVAQDSTEVINWTDDEFIGTGTVVFSASTGTNDYWTETANPIASTNPSFVKRGLLSNGKMLTWDFNSANGGLQYTLRLDPNDPSSTDDFGNDEWKIGSIGLYVRAQNYETKQDNGDADVLFGVASLQTPATMHATTVDGFGTSLTFKFNMILNNLGFVSNLEIIPQEECKLPEVPNDSLIENTLDPLTVPFNCYLVDNMHGTNIPAIAIARGKNEAGGKAWSYIYPSDNTLYLKSSDFADNVSNYSFVTWDSATRKYILAAGQSNGQSPNTKMPIGLRVGNAIVYSGEITNKGDKSYSYHLPEGCIVAQGSSYKEDDQLLVTYSSAATTDLIFKIRVTHADTDGKIIAVDAANLEPNVGNINCGEFEASAIYSPYSQYPQFGVGARFRIASKEIVNNGWNFTQSDLNKPLYCGTDGKPTTVENDSFIGWCTGINRIHLALDLRNEATYDRYGTTRYATDNEVRCSTVLVDANEVTALNPKTAHKNYLQITKCDPNSDGQKGDQLINPIDVNTFVKFNEIVVGKGINTPYTEETNPHITDANISFYGVSYRSYWADLAEFYESDEIYQPGTLITLGKGTKEISIAIDECNGIVSEKPGYQLGEKKTQYHLPVALVGRVPVLFDGHCMPKFGDKIYLSKVKKGCASTVPNGKCLGKIITKNTTTSKLLECAVRIEF